VIVSSARSGAAATPTCVTMQGVSFKYTPCSTSPASGDHLDPDRAVRDLVVNFTRTFLAVDWGTTNRRVFLIDGRRGRRTERDDQGRDFGYDFEAEAAAIRSRFGESRC
jgi:hypothetical protein